MGSRLKEKKSSKNKPNSKNKRLRLIKQSMRLYVFLRTLYHSLFLGDSLRYHKIQIKKLGKHKIILSTGDGESWFHLLNKGLTLRSLSWETQKIKNIWMFYQKVRSTTFLMSFSMLKIDLQMTTFYSQEISQRKMVVWVLCLYSYTIPTFHAFRQFK